jgi:uncharacterized membrane protein YjdF
VTVPDVVHVSADKQRALTRLLQAVLGLILLYGLLTLQFGMASNGAFGLALTLVPAAIRREYDYTMSPVLVLWITIAVSLHSVGALGPYESVPWYDSVTHTLSGTVAGGLGYATFHGFERHSEELTVPARFRPVFIFVFVLAISVIWELIEFASGILPTLVGIDAPLVVYGVDDIVTDMLFNTLGAVVLSAGASGYFKSLGGFFRRRFDSRSS